MIPERTTDRTKKRYTPEEKQKVIDYILQYKSDNSKKSRRGAQKAAAAHFNISTVTISSWMKSIKGRPGRKPGSKNTIPRGATPLALASPPDLRQLASMMEQIAELEAQTEKLAALKLEAAALQAKIMAK